MPAQDPSYIIAIGASAGGTEELISFFDHTPADGVSYIIVQHLSSSIRSRMAEILNKHSKLILNEAGDGMKVETNQIYLIPSDKFLTIRDGRLYLTRKENEKGPHLTVNMLFNSLAADMGKKAIGVILSGLGSDGTEGIKAIKKAGGMVMARNPETTGFGSMPSSAIATGLVDFVLEPASMPGAIETYIKREGMVLTDNQSDEKYLKAIVDLINEKSPHDFSDYKQPTILRRTRRRANYYNFTKLENYLDFLKKTPQEVDTLAKEFLISVTSFFRDKEAFDFIQKDILPVILQKLAPGEELKMWVAGCATGEEAYSLAMLTSEKLTGPFKDTVVKIFATDIDTAALVQAGKGVYTPSILKNVSPERIERHFLKEGDSYRIKPEIRKMIIFAQHDLVKNPPYCNMHFISCRNLLIYMTPALQKKVFAMMLFGLKMEGYLFLGSSEHPMSIIQNLEIINRKWKIYKNMETKRVLRLDAFSLPEFAETKPVPLLFSREEASNAIATLAETIAATMAKDQEQLVVCVDENNHVVKAFGDTTKFLLQKNFNSNLTELLPRPYAVAFNALSTEALKLNEKRTLSGIKANSNPFITMSVSPLRVKSEQNWLMVTFSEDRSDISTQNEANIFDEKIYFNQYTLNIEEELKVYKDKLYFAHEKLDASNENMQSFNEELLSANEEMQSTNEEMQSVNEELHTINVDYQLKNKELIEMNDDLNNYFRSNINGQLFVNNDLMLMKFSPGTTNQINLLPTDVGRPLNNISTNIKFETITEDIKQVLKDGSIITKEVETDNGKWYQIMTMPYIQQADNKSNGAIITFNDITTLKKTQLELNIKNKSLLRINADLDNFIYTVSHDLITPLNNIESIIGMMNDKNPPDGELSEYIDVLNVSIDKFRSLIKDIASVAKLEDDIVIEMVDMDETMNNIEWSLEDKIKSSGAVITRNFELKHIPFSKKNLRSIVYNLISNSIKFKSEANPLVNISIKKEEGYIILIVHDNGIGMSKNSIDKIFNKYTRLQPDVEGQGIGLYLVKKIIHAAGGEIIVDSEPGSGSKFILHFKI